MLVASHLLSRHSEVFAVAGVDVRRINHQQTGRRDHNLRAFVGVARRRWIWRWRGLLNWLFDRIQASKTDGPLGVIQPRRSTAFRAWSHVANLRWYWTHIV